MRPLNQYDTYIFDCDGVILDSNKLKIEAMKAVLEELAFESSSINSCITYFKNNFGLSRFHHAQVFIDSFLSVEDKSKQETFDDIIKRFSIECKSLYLQSDITKGFIEFVEGLNGKAYVASGSEQSELRDVLKIKGLSNYFAEIFGSPTKKTDIVSNICNSNGITRALFIGDAISDLEAAKSNNIDFIAYLPYSNTPELLKEKSEENGFMTINDFKELSINE